MKAAVYSCKEASTLILCKPMMEKTSTKFQCKESVSELDTGYPVSVSGFYF